MLLRLKYVEYFTKSGQRKRYFRASKAYVKIAMGKYNASFEKETEVVEKINGFNRKNNPEKFKNEESIGVLYKDYLAKLTEGFQQKIEQVKELENQA